jgi:hypothetical protein
LDISHVEAMLGAEADDQVEDGRLTVAGPSYAGSRAQLRRIEQKGR